MCEELLQTYSLCVSRVYDDRALQRTFVSSCLIGTIYGGGRLRR